MKVLFYIAILISSCLKASAQVDTLLSKVMTPADMHEDFSLLRRVLTETHPGLYRYNTKEAMQAKMDSVNMLLDGPMPFYDFYFIISKLIADVRCAHTYAVPVKNIEGFFLNGIKTIPLIPFQIDDRFYATVNGSPEKTIKPGFEVLEINSKPILAIRDEIYRHVWADGFNKTLKAKTISEVYFALFYYMCIEQPDSFAVKVRTPDGEEKIVVLQAQTFKKTMSDVNSNEVNKEIMARSNKRGKLENKRPWRIKILEGQNTAVIRIKSFGGGQNDEQARAKMHDFMEKCMKTLSSNKTENLIIDLRSNPGGWDIQGVELFTYLTDKPARCYKTLHAVTDSTEFIRYSDLSPSDIASIKKELKKESDGTFSAREEYNDQLRIQNPKPNHFKGNVYVLANGGSASTTSEFVAYAKSNNTITLVGEETGGAYEGGNGGSFLHFNLPKSKISVGTPLLSYDNAVNQPAQKGRGTKPDYEVPLDIENLLKGHDVQMAFVLKLISKK